MRYFYLFLAIIFSLHVIAQTDSTHISDDRLLRINYENDYFSQTDMYFTQGVRIELIAPFIYKSIVSKLLFSGSKKNLHFYGLAIQRDGFTPKSIRISDIYYGERPYAGTMFLSHFHINLNTLNHLKTTMQLDIGMIGSAVGGNEEQTAIHKLIGGVKPQGWHNQIANDIILNYKAQYEKGLIKNKYLEFIALGEGRLGTLYTDVSMGAMIRTGFMNSYFMNIGITKSKSLQKFQCYVFAKGNVKAVAYNGTMQGGVFNRHSVYTISDGDVERIVGLGFAGIVIAYKQFSMEYTKARISPEFNGGLKHGWGHCNISICF